MRFACVVDVFRAQLKELSHINITSFIGACVEPGHICYLMQFCSRGTVQASNPLHTNSPSPICSAPPTPLYASCYNSNHHWPMQFDCIFITCRDIWITFSQCRFNCWCSSSSLLWSSFLAVRAVFLVSCSHVSLLHTFCVFSLHVLYVIIPWYFPVSVASRTLKKHITSR